MSRLMLISSDCHNGAPWEGYRPFVDKQYLTEFDAWVAHTKAHEAETRAWRRDHFTKEFQERYNSAAEKKTGRESDMAWDVGVFDPAERARLLDEDGVAAEVLFSDPSRRNAVPFRTISGAHNVPVGYNGHVDLVIAGQRAYNRWMAEHCAKEPHRRIGLAYVSLADIPGALAEIRWAKQAGLRGIVVTAYTEGEGVPTYDNVYYEPIWKLCEELDMPVHTHGGSGPAQRILPALVFSGVLERHPRLRFVWTEQGCNWIPPLLEEMDTIYKEPLSGKRLRAALPLTPSQYWERNCWVGHSTRHIKSDWELRYKIGVHKMMWGHDFPHPEGAWPYTKDSFPVLANLSEQELRTVLGKTAAKFYGIDASKLTALVERIGPEASAFKPTSEAEKAETAVKNMMAGVR